MLSRIGDYVVFAPVMSRRARTPLRVVLLSDKALDALGAGLGVLIVVAIAAKAGVL